MILRKAVPACFTCSGGDGERYLDGGHSLAGQRGGRRPLEVQADRSAQALLSTGCPAD